MSLRYFLFSTFGLLQLFAPVFVQADSNNEATTLKDYSQKLNETGERIFIGYNVTLKNPSQVSQYFSQLTQLEGTLASIKKSATTQLGATKWTNVHFQYALEVVLATQETYSQLIAAIRLRDFQRMTYYDYHHTDFPVQFLRILTDYPDYTQIKDYIPNAFKTWNNTISRFVANPTKSSQNKLHEELNRFASDLGHMSSRLDKLCGNYYEKARKANQCFEVAIERNLRLRVVAYARFSQLCSSLRDSVDQVKIDGHSNASILSITLSLLFSSLFLMLFLN